MKNILLYLFFVTFFGSCNIGFEKVTNSPIINISKQGIITHKDGTTRSIPDFNTPDVLVLFIVRHAERQIVTDNSNPDLTEAGHQRAVQLSKILQNIRFEKAVTSSTTRAIATADPLRNAQGGIPIETYTTDQQEQVAKELIKRQKGKNILWVGHSNTIPKLLNFLAQENKYQNDIPDDEFDNFYIVTIRQIGEIKILKKRY